MNARLLSSKLWPGTHRRSSRIVAFGALIVLGFSGACGTLESRKLTPAGAAGEDADGTGGTRPSGGRAGTKNSSSAGEGQGGGGDEALCGDGVRQRGEGCDDGNVRNHDGCSDECAIEPTEPACGDQLLSGGEECDDGNLQAGDGCDARCRKEECGNERLEPGEECDPPRSGTCTKLCHLPSPHCGDGDVQENEGEQCDDGNLEVGDGCSECRADCGDGRIDKNHDEECEPAYSDHCSDSCKWLPTCGDGEVQASAGEECDPSNGETCVDCKHVSPMCGDGGGGCGAGGDGGGACVPEVSDELVQNGAFTNGTSGWSSPDAANVLLTPVNQGAPAPGLQVDFAPGPVRAVSGAYQCLPIGGERTYKLTAKYFIAADAPAGVGASVTAILYPGTRCDGTPLGAPQTGLVGEVRDAWTPYALTVDTSLLGASAQARVLLRLNVLRPPYTTGARVQWDSVSMTNPGARCGNCTVDAGETCDDGNQRAGDGCNPSCRKESCGDGVRSGGEACDDGNTVYATGDSCTPTCATPSACDVCSAAQCGDEVAACLGLDGEAEAGPEAGTSRSTLCDALRVCVRESACNLIPRHTSGIDGAYAENCYCGTAGVHCFDEPGAANGSCRREVEAALETTDPEVVLARFDGAGTSYPLFSAMKEALSCENAKCNGSCARVPECGNGHVEDRNLELTFVVKGEEVACDDALTITKRGCSFEECDDDNLEPGDGCDEHCLLEACGNYVVQAGEECDDGNHTDNDGCSSDCKAESTCGENGVEAPFEECDLPTDTPDGSGKLCTVADYASDPDQCGCDTRCHRNVCGNGVIQRPAEECDPPNGVNCDVDCKKIGQGPCEACINAYPATGPYNETLCDPDPLCVAVRQCVIAHSSCLSNYATCYCGDNTNDCDLPAFVPNGPCAREIRAGAGTDNPTNEQVLNRQLVFLDYPTGTAMNILLAAIIDPPEECQEECTAL